LAIVGRDNGVERFFARTLADNVVMRHILTRAGARMEADDPGVVQTTMDLPPPSGRFNPEMVAAVARTAAAERHRRIA
jgi:hypothetical protein